MNPQVGQKPPSNSLPFFITPDGPAREARFKFFLDPDGTIASATPDGNVHDVFTIVGLPGAQGCNIAQPNFDLMQKLNNIVFRIPTPVFGGGLIENITDQTLLKNASLDPSVNPDATFKQQLGIGGRVNRNPNRSGNDGTITRFGWKARNKSLLLFAGEAYNVEMGITNELFQNERGNSSTQNDPNDPPNSCLLNPTPEDQTNFTQLGVNGGLGIPSDIVAFMNFMRFLDQPKPDVRGIPGNPSLSSIQNGEIQFENVHCNLCHTETLKTFTSSFDMPPNTATAPFLSNQDANLFSDLLIHHMGSGLADGITQGAAGPDEFRTAPLWGVGQRIFFLHDGRATPKNGGLLRAIQQHASTGSEANQVISLFNALSDQNKQDILNFLRSL